MSDFRVALWTGILGQVDTPHGVPPTLQKWTISRPTDPVFAICFSPLIFLFLKISRYRTLSVHVEEKSSKATPDKVDAIRQIDVHTLSVDLVYQRFSTSPTLGLESPAIARLTQSFGKNIISPPKTQYWKKVLNYIFGGFNFLMWIAFIVTIVSRLTSFHQNC